MARIAIIGPGAIGGTLAGNLLRGGRHEIVLCGRRPVETVRVRFPDGESVATGPVVAEPESVFEGEFDWLIVATKTYAAEDTAVWLRPLMAEKTRVAIFQNGVEHRERFSPWVPEQTLVPVIIDCPAERPTPDEVVQRGDLNVVAPDNEAGQALRELFAGVNEHFVLTDDILTAAWRKLTRNSIAVLNAMTLQPNVIMHEPAMAQAALKIAREAIAVGRAAGAKLNDDLAEWVITATLEESPDGVNSLLADRLAGRETELDARNGAIVRTGERLGVPTPLNAMGVAVVEAQIRKEQTNCD
ncbi:2-dehydropantoate 2-reductase [Opitutaceae bacterium]|nr:2-dehydropantoate 2-reductase [Opitutaceae bacterium]